MSRISTSWTRRIGVAMMSAALAIAMVVATGGPVGAQEADQRPEDAEEAEVQKHAFYDAPLSSVIPPSVMASFPPQVVCLVVVKACTGDFDKSQPDQVNEGFNAATGGAEEGQDQIQTNDPGEPESPVPPDTLPVSITTGRDRYRSAVAFELPTVPDGDQVDDFKIYLTETDPTGGISSPALRQAILAAMTCVRGCQNDQFEKILTSEPAESQTLGVEMCPIVDNPSTEEENADWDEGRSQDPESMPETDCFLGANGRRLDDGTWEFDMSFALDAWASGEIPNNGVLIIPQGAPNFAFGDPDSSFNKQVTFEKKVEYTVATSEATEVASLPPAGSFGTTSSSTTSAGGSSSFSAPSGGVSGNTSTFSAPANEGTAGEPAPEVAGDTGAQQPATEPVAAGGPQQQPGSAWYAWLVAPIFLAGAYLTVQSLSTPASVLANGTKEGAMSRLLAQQASSAPSGPQLA